MKSLESLSYEQLEQIPEFISSFERARALDGLFREKAGKYLFPPLITGAKLVFETNRTLFIGAKYNQEFKKARNRFVAYEVAICSSVPLLIGFVEWYN